MHRVIAVAVIAAVLSACSHSEELAIGDVPGSSLKQSTVCAAWGGIVPLDQLLDTTEIANPYDIHLPQAPDSGNTDLRPHFFEPEGKVFNDLNPVQLAAAQQAGIAPVSSITHAWSRVEPLVHIRSCREYFVDELTHSYPFLVPEAAALLRDIGRAFCDSLAARGGGYYRIKVTSLLRTDASVQRLRRVNVNASQTSTHIYGTSFDISYSKFICDSIGVTRNFGQLKNLLAEIIRREQLADRCYVKYERKQACFHITVRPPILSDEDQTPTL